MKNLKTLTVLALAPIIMVGCAKDTPYDEVYKEVKEASKNEFITEENGQPVKYLYVPMTLGTPREVTQADPFYQGDEKIVRLEWSEAGLEVLEIEKDRRFAENDLNDTPVLTIPGSYASYRCREDSYGKCTNAEEENNELEWFQKDKFTPNFEGLQVREINMLDVSTVEADSCVQHAGTKLVDYEVSPGVINVELEKTYKLSSSWGCIWSNYVNDKFSYNSFKVRFFYSLVRLDQVASKKYEPIHYPIPDHDDFGFFKNEELVLKDDFDPERKIRKVLLNRWNPVRENNELVYHLSASYNKPENKLLKDATFKAIEVMNNSMKDVNIPFKIKLVEAEGKGKNPGDLRNNMIVLIDDPLANGLLGYGPTVTNPLTGEIVQGHVNMYGGVLKTMSRHVWEAAVDLTIDKKKEKTKEETLAGVITVNPAAYTNLPNTLATMTAVTSGFDPAATAGDDAQSQKIKKIVNLMERAHDKKPGHVHTEKTHALERVSLNSVEKKIEKRIHQKRDMKLEQVLKIKGENLSEFEKHALKEEARIARWAENNAFAEEAFPIAGTVKVIYPDLMNIPGVLNADGTLKRWSELNDEQKAQGQNIILVNSYTSTLIHELGHNLGLRHNFMGSWDKDNFYSDEEARALGLDAAPAYSSIMDYAFSNFNELMALGKYDLAALRFAYAQEVETDTGVVLKIKGSVSEFKKALEDAKKAAQAKKDELTAKLELLQNDVTSSTADIKNLVNQINDTDKILNAKDRKAYAFCTDENAGLSSICNRFDEGTTLPEVANHKIKRYYDLYKYRNFRDGRLDYSSYDLGGYLIARYWEFASIRDIVEEYEFFQTIFGADLMSQGCSPEDTAKYPVCKMINERKEAVDIVGNFFIDVLKTPDHICAVTTAQEPTVIVEFKKLAEIYDEVKYDISHVTTSCFDPAVEAKLAEEGKVVVGEVGKFLNGFKDNDPNFKYSSDRATRGIWMDKVMAMKYLYQRTWKNGSTDEENMALVDNANILAKTQDVLAHLVLGQPLTGPQPFTMKDGRKFQVPYVIGSDYKVEPVESALSWVTDFLGLPAQGRSDLLTTQLKQIARIGTDYGQDYADSAYNTVNFVTKTRISSISDTDLLSKNYVYFDADDMIYAARTNNALAYTMISTINTKDLLDSAGAMVVSAVIEARSNPQAPAELSAEEVAYFELDVQWQESLINYAQNNAPLTLQAFVGTFGQELGAKLFAVYQTGAARMQEILVIKETLANTPPADASKEVVALYNVPLELLQMYVQGLITDELVNHYASQLDKLPQHRNHPNK